MNFLHKSNKKKYLYYFFIFYLCLFTVILCQSAVYSPSGGPVYNPNGAPVVSAVSIVVQPTSKPENNFITQTVYGFLDFTTTIGNTVMVFSPQSAAPGMY